MKKHIRLVCIMIISMIISGCITSTTYDIWTTKRWENHYLTVDAFKEGTKDIVLQEGETVWVLSSTTLKRVLKNTEKK